MSDGKKTKSTMALLTLSALGVVYGDIGTSPLYALRECFSGIHGIPLLESNIIAVLSLILWAFISVVSIKYLIFILRADNQGEGGVLALMALALNRKEYKNSRRNVAITFLGICGAALLYGDGVITPAISVLSAIEGLGIGGSTFFDPYVIPITLLILVLLFSIQKIGTGRIGRMFGPIMVVWFACLALSGIRHIFDAPVVLTAVNPMLGLRFLWGHSALGLQVLCAVFLVLTGAEALYADMGHFGKIPIRYGWFTFVFPSLVLNYFGQGALLIHTPAAIVSPFYLLFPAWALYPVVGLATAATVIASQALISGCFSLTHQAVQLGLLPRIVTKHTSENEQGQIYIPTINWLMLLGTLWLVSTFKSSANLTAAYGIAVAGTMVITSILFYFVAYSRWHWPWWTVSFLTFVFLIIDFSFLSANFPKIIHGGWFALLVAGVISGLILTWRRGTQILAERMAERSISYEKFMKDIQEHPPVRIPGTAVYLTGTDEGVSQALIHNLRHNRVLNENVVSVTVRTAPVAHIHPDKHLQVTKLESGFYTVIIYYGFMDRPNIPMALELAKDLGLDCELLNVAYFIGRRTLLATDRPGMAIWREQLFAMMAKNAQNSGVFFKIPPDRVIEIGYQVEL